MSCDWPSIRLGELADITSSKRIKRADYVSSGVPFFRSKEVIERSKGNDISTELFISEEHFSVIRDKFGAPEAGDILLTSVGTLGVPYQVRSADRFYFKDGNLTWLRRFQESVLPEYVLYWLRSPVAQRKLDEVSIGSTQRALTIIALKSVEIPLPPKAVQARIVDIAMSLDQKFEANRAINQILEQMAQAIFKSWFVDFEPVKAKIAALEAGGSEEDALLAAMQAISAKDEIELARLQAEQPEQYAELHATAELFPSAMQDSELGEIPEGWEVLPLGTQASALRGFSYKGKGLSDTGIPMHNLNSILEGGGYKYVGIKYYSLDFNTKFEVQAGDVLVANTEQGHDHLLIGFGAIVPHFYQQGIFSHHLYRLRPKADSNLTPQFLGCMFRHESFVKKVQGYANGTTVNMLPRSGVEMPEFICPSRDLISAFSKTVAPLHLQAEKRHLQNESLSELRDTLLPKLLSGELSVADAETQLTEAEEAAHV